MLSRLPEIAYVREFMIYDATRDNYYQRFLVTAMEHVMEGDVGESVFLNFLLSFTPPRIIADAVVPELEPGGRLQGFFDEGGKGTGVRRHIERHLPKRVVSAGRPEPSPDFSPYARYVRADTREQHPTLVAYIFRSDPRVALHTIMAVTDSLDERVNLQALARDEHFVHDMIWHHENNFEIEPERLRSAKDALERLAKHEQWWVRLYVAEILRRYPDLGTPEMIDRLKTDEHDLVRQVFLESGGKAETDQRPARQNDTQKLQPGGG
jgi:hypothetical protein